MARGFVSLVGAGPGDADHLTVRGLRVLGAAEVVVYDALLADNFQALFPVGAERCFVGKRAGLHSVSQEHICELLVKHGRAGRRVVRLKGGDAGVFGHLSEEIAALADAGISYEIVPGVSSITAGAACAGFPLTSRGVSASILVVDGHSVAARGDIGSLAQHSGTLVVLMASRSIATIAAGLIAAGAPATRPLALVEGASFRQQQIFFSSLGEAAAGHVQPTTQLPGIVYIGDVARPACASALAEIERGLHAA
jgi:uroporphyrin-III C-methyltransferase